MPALLSLSPCQVSAKHRPPCWGLPCCERAQQTPGSPRRHSALPARMPRTKQKGEHRGPWPFFTDTSCYTAFGKIYPAGSKAASEDSPQTSLWLPARLLPSSHPGLRWARQASAAPPVQSQASTAGSHSSGAHPPAAVLHPQQQGSSPWTAPHFPHCWQFLCTHPAASTRPKCPHPAPKKPTGTFCLLLTSLPNFFLF